MEKRSKMWLKKQVDRKEVDDRDLRKRIEQEVDKKSMCERGRGRWQRNE